MFQTVVEFFLYMIGIKEKCTQLDAVAIYSSAITIGRVNAIIRECSKILFALEVGGGGLFLTCGS